MKDPVLAELQPFTVQHIEQQRAGNALAATPRDAQRDDLAPRIGPGLRSAAREQPLAPARLAAARVGATLSAGALAAGRCRSRPTGAGASIARLSSRQRCPSPSAGWRALGPRGDRAEIGGPHDGLDPRVARAFAATLIRAPAPVNVRDDEHGGGEQYPA